MTSGTSYQEEANAPHHHVEDDMLLAYAAGTLNEAASVIVAAHIGMCRRCRNAARVAEMIGGAALEASAPVDVAPLNLEKLDSATHDEHREVGSVFGVQVPPAVAPYLPTQPLRWRFLQPGIRFAELFTDSTGTRFGFMRTTAGTVATTHSHSGEEMAMVLSGGYRDGSLAFRRGDVQTSDETVTHAPVTDSDGPCLLLLAIRGPIRPTTFLARLLRPFTGF